MQSDNKWHWTGHLSYSLPLTQSGRQTQTHKYIHTQRKSSGPMDSRMHGCKIEHTHINTHKMWSYRSVCAARIGLFHVTKRVPNIAIVQSHLFAFPPLMQAHAITGDTQNPVWYVRYPNVPTLERHISIRKLGFNTRFFFVARYVCREGETNQRLAREHFVLKMIGTNSSMTNHDG